MFTVGKVAKPPWLVETPRLTRGLRLQRLQSEAIEVSDRNTAIGRDRLMEPRASLDASSPSTIPTRRMPTSAATRSNSPRSVWVPEGTMPRVDRSAIAAVAAALSAWLPAAAVAGEDARGTGSPQWSYAGTGGPAFLGVLDRVPAVADRHLRRAPRRGRRSGFPARRWTPRRCCPGRERISATRARRPRRRAARACAGCYWRARSRRAGTGSPHSGASPAEPLEPAAVCFHPAVRPFRPAPRGLPGGRGPWQ